MRRTLVVCSFLFLAPSLAQGQTSKSVVTAQMLLATDGVHPGATVKAALVAQIAPGYHINDNKPSREYLIPTELKLEANRLVSLVKTVYPKGELRKFAFSDDPLSVYEGTVVLGALLRVARTARPGTSISIKGKLSYQACNDHACLPPTSVPLTLAAKLVGRKVPLKRVNADVFSRINFE